MKISFIISAKNEERYIEDCLKSIIFQDTKEEYEILLIDSGSADNTTEIAKKIFSPVKVIFEPKVGITYARQSGVLNSQGEVLIFLDSDVRLPNSLWLNKVLKKINEPNVIAVSTHYQYYEMPFLFKVIQMFGTVVFIYPWIFIIDKIFKHSTHMIGGMMVIKKIVLEKAGGIDYNTEFYGDEISIVKKIYNFGKIIVSPKVWVYTSGRRYVSGGLINTVFKYVLNYFWVLFFGYPYHKGRVVTRD